MADAPSTVPSGRSYGFNLFHRAATANGYTRPHVTLPERTMIRSMACTACFFAFTLFASAAPGDEEKAVRGILEAQQTAWNKGDLVGFMDGYWKDDKLFYISGGNTVQGWKALKERYEKVYQGEGKEMGKLKFSELNVEMLGTDAAFVRGKWEVVTAKETIGGWFTLVMKKLPDGWKVTHDHTSK